MLTKHLIDKITKHTRGGVSVEVQIPVSPDTPIPFADGYMYVKASRSCLLESLSRYEPDSPAPFVPRYKRHSHNGLYEMLLDAFPMSTT